MKFYHALNCNRPLQAGSFAVNFTPYELTSCWAGVYSTDKPDEVAELDKLVAGGRITALSEAEYENAIRKKREASNGYAPSLATSTPTPGQAAPAAGQAVDTQPEPVIAEQSKPLESVEEAITPVPVAKKARK